MQKNSAFTEYCVQKKWGFILNLGTLNFERYFSSTLY